MIDPTPPQPMPTDPPERRFGSDEPGAGVMLRIRPASHEDAVGIARLSGQLTVPSDGEQVRARLDKIARNPIAQVFVAELPDAPPGGAALVGWIQVMLLDLVVSDSGAVVVGLVVDESHRKMGVGRHLVNKAEAWAKSLGCQTVVVRSREHRTGAHEFYERMGYEEHKVQRSFRKRLD